MNLLGLIQNSILNTSPHSLSVLPFPYSGKVKNELWVRIYKLRVQIYELRVQIHELGN